MAGLDKDAGNLVRATLAREEFAADEFLVGFGARSFLMTNRKIAWFKKKGDTGPTAIVRLSALERYETKGWWTFAALCTLKSGERKKGRCVRRAKSALPSG